MKNGLILSFILLAFAACKRPEGSDIESKKTKLATLRTQYTALKTEIETLEKEVKTLDPTATVSEKSFSVEVTTVAPETFIHSVDVQGAVVADQEMMITPRTAGTITRLTVQTGSKVSVGQVIGEIDDAILSQGMAELAQQLNFATDLYTKQKSLWDQGIGSEVQFLSAKNNKEAMEKRIATMEEQRKLNKVLAPISGTIDEVYAKVGQTVAPGVPFAKILNFSKLKVTADIAEGYAGKLREGNEVVVALPDLKRNVDGRIRYIGKTINPINRTYKVEVPLAANEKDVIPNMVSTLKIIDYKKIGAIVIPINLIQKGAMGDFVYILKKDGEKTTAKKMPISIGQTYNDKAEVLSGLKAGDALISTGAQDLNDGDGVILK